MTHRKKKYLTPQAIDYVIATKFKLRSIIVDRGWTIDALTEATGIPQSTMSRWLNPEKTDFMGLADAAVIADCLGVTVRELLADPIWRDLDPHDDRYLYIRPLMQIPIAHVKLLIEYYWRFRDLFDSGDH